MSLQRVRHSHISRSYGEKVQRYNLTVFFFVYTASKLATVLALHVSLM
jgi:hypothetical protein